MDLIGKKLLILGGTNMSCEIVQKAKELGLYVIVADYDENAPAKIIADKASMVSATDVDAVLNLIKEEGIDGILTGFIELLLPFYQQICEKASLPCYATKEQIEIATNKIKFKQLCRDFNIPVVEEFQINLPISNINCQNISYPVLIKPIDNTAGRGISTCSNFDELTKNFDKSLSYSPSKTVIVEKYMPWKEATIFYTAQDGNIFLTAIADRHTQNRQNKSIPLPVAYIFPSEHLKAYIDTLDSEVINMFKSVGIQNGLIFIQSFVKNGNFVFYEMGFRLTGTLEYHILSKTNNINILEHLIRFAITGKMSENPLYNRIVPNTEKFGGNITFLLKPGKIGRIDGESEILELQGVTSCFISYKEGDVIPDRAVGTLLQVIARVFFVTNSKLELINVMNAIHSIFRVYSSDGQNMLLKTFDTRELMN